MKVFVNKLYVFFNKHMEFRIQARLCLAIYYFESHIMLAYVYLFKVPDYRWEKFNSNEAATFESL